MLIQYFFFNTVKHSKHPHNRLYDNIDKTPQSKTPDVYIVLHKIQSTQHRFNPNLHLPVIYFSASLSNSTQLCSIFL